MAMGVWWRLINTFASRHARAPCLPCKGVAQEVAGKADERLGPRMFGTIGLGT